MYLAVKYVHVISVVLSLTGFFLRGILMMRDSPLLAARWVRVLPHINDTVLLIAALTLAAQARLVARLQAGTQPIAELTGQQFQFGAAQFVGIAVKG